MLRRACRLAWRGTGGASPNPRVGCVITNTIDGITTIVGWGYHRQAGTPHAEIHALRRAGHRGRGGTAYVTLEPCNHTGRTGPCTEAILNAGVARVVYAEADPNPAAAGGAERLREAGIDVDHVDDDPFASWILAPFRHVTRTGRPWVIAKWAQTVDGRIATRTGESQWISSCASRRLVHRWRGQVDGVLTGIGTVLADDPLLTARDVRTRRTPARIVIDPHLQIPPRSQLVTTAHAIRTIVATNAERLDDASSSVEALRHAGVLLLPVELDRNELPLEPLLRTLCADHDIHSLIVDAGGGVMGRLAKQQLMNELRVFVAPTILGDDLARTSIRGMVSPALTDGMRLRLMRTQRRSDDVILTYAVDDQRP